jgi:hypothetical protein
MAGEAAGALVWSGVAGAAAGVLIWSDEAGVAGWAAGTFVAAASFVALFWAMSVGGSAPVSEEDEVDWEKSAPPGRRAANKTARRTDARKLLI